jgi:hypothetical protein
MSKFTEVWQDQIVENTHEYKKGREGYEYANSWKDVTDRELTTLWRSVIYTGPVEPNWHDGGLTFGVVVSGEIHMQIQKDRQNDCEELVFKKGDMILDHNTMHNWVVPEYAHVVFLIHPKEK